MRFPDYRESILSIPASLLDFYGETGAYPREEALALRLREAPTRCVVVLLLDGMGESLLRRQLGADAFLVKHDARALSTVYPSTTTAATTSVWTGLSPLQHGWLGWSLYFKECGRQIDTFLDRDSHTHEAYKAAQPARAFMPLANIYPKFAGRARTHTVYPFPSYATAGADCAHTVSGFSDAARLIVSLANDPGEQVIFCYCPEPDHEMHQTGVASPETARVFARLNAQVEAMAKALPGDALLIVTADHGLVNVKENVDIRAIEPLNRCLYMPPSMEARAASLFVKPHRKAQFETEFKAVFGDDFLLIPHEEVFSSHLLGLGEAHPKADDFIGDYLACAVGARAIEYKTPAHDGHVLVGQHAGLTDDEMTVPLILYRNR